ncbi:hypothetical protein LCGC14_2600040, partial [marine sediment metagenome]
IEFAKNVRESDGSGMKRRLVGNLGVAKAGSSRKYERARERSSGS